MKDFLNHIHQENRRGTKTWTENFNYCEVSFADTGYLSRALSTYFGVNIVIREEDEISERNLTINNYIKYIRSRVEHVFGRCNFTFRILRTSFRFELEWYDTIYCCCYALNNVRIDEKDGAFTDMIDEIEESPWFKWDYTPEENELIRALPEYDLEIEDDEYEEEDEDF